MAIGLSTILFIVINKAVSTGEVVKEKMTITKSGSDRVPLFELFTLDSVPYSKCNLKKKKKIQRNF